jgi:hypothetical protein
MKKTLIVILGLAFLLSCSNQNTQKKEEKNTASVVLTVDELLAQGKDLVGKEVIVKGTVTHVCKESGARCFVMGSNEDISLRIEAGKIGSFSQEQMGSDIQVSGILQEVKLEEEDLAEMGKAAAAGETANIGHALGHDGPKLHDVDGGKHDSINQMKKLDDMNQKLAESTEGYVPVYYLDGLKLVEQK